MHNESGYRVVEGLDIFHNRKMFRVIGRGNDYVGEWHDNRKDAEAEIAELKGTVGGDTIKKLMTLNRLAKELSRELNKIDGIKVTPDFFLRMAKHGKFRYDLGKYDPSSKGKPAQTKKPIWYENRSDRYGPYIVICTVNEDWITDFEKGIWEAAVKVWNNAA